MSLTLETTRILPIFAHHGAEDSVPGAIMPISLCGDYGIVVGSTTGCCTLYSVSPPKRIAVLWNDPEKRQIVALGKWHFPETILDGDKTYTIDRTIWIHFRGAGVEVFQLSESEGCLLRLSKRIRTSHYGFCSASGDWSYQRFMVPEYEDGTNTIKIRHGGAERSVRIGEKFLVDNFLAASTSLNAEQITRINPFKGMLMAMEPATGWLPQNANLEPDSPIGYRPNDSVFLAFEDSTIALYNFQLKHVIDFVKHPKYHQFVCWAVRKFSDGVGDAIGNGKIFFAVSTMKQTYLVDFNPTTMAFEVCCIIRKTQSINSTALELFTNQAGARCVACGLSSGLVEIYSLQASHGGGKATFASTLCSTLDYHSGSSITMVKWTDFSVSDFGYTEESEACSKKPSQPQSSLLFVGCSSGKLSHYSV